MFGLLRGTLLAISLCLAPACSSALVEPESGEVPASDEAGRVTDLWVSDPATDLDSSKVLIVLQGGPRNYLYFERDGRTLARYLPGYGDYHVVYLHQSQTLNPDMFALGDRFSLEDARAARTATTDMLKRAILHFKSQGKTVVVVGHSYGAFIIVDYLSNRDAGADQYIVSAGRISVPRDMVEDHKRGWSSEFEADGITYIPASMPAFTPEETMERGAYRVRALLKAAYGEPQYAENLRSRNLEKVSFISGRSDQSVGTLTQEEKSVLEMQGAHVFCVEGGHSDVYKRMIDLVDAGDIVLK